MARRVRQLAVLLASSASESFFVFSFYNDYSCSYPQTSAALMQLPQRAHAPHSSAESMVVVGLQRQQHHEQQQCIMIFRSKSLIILQTTTSANINGDHKHRRGQ